MEGLLIFLVFCVAAFLVLRFVYRRVPALSQPYRVIVVTSETYAEVRIAKRLTRGAYYSDRLGGVSQVWFSAPDSFQAELETAITDAEHTLEKHYAKARRAKEAKEQIKQVSRKVKT